MPTVTALPDSFSLIHDHVYTGPSVLANDSNDTGEAMTASLVKNLDHGTLSLKPDGTFIAAFDAGFVGTDKATYQATTPSGASAAAEISFIVTNAAPTASDASLSVLHDKPLTIDLNQFADDADGDPLTFSINGPSNGQLALNQDGTYTYTPNAGWTGSDSFGFTASDGIATSSEATVTISVTNQAPVAVAENFTLHAGLLLSLDSTSGILHEDYDPDADPLVVQLVGAAPASGTLNLNADGSFTYQANQGFVGDDTFNYRLFDGAAYSATMAVTIHVQDQAPIASASSFDVWAAQGVTTGTANVLANATDPENDALTAVLVALPTYAAPNSFQLNVDGTFSYQLMADAPTTFNGQDSFSFMAFDGTLNSAPVTVTLNITDTAVGKDSAYILDSSGVLTVSAAQGVLANAFNPMQLPLAVDLVQAPDPSVGTVSLHDDGSFEFTKGPNFAGEAQFVFFRRGRVQPCRVRIITQAELSAAIGLTSVRFNGNATIQSDGNAAPQNLQGPQWLDLNSDGVIDTAAGDHQYPVSFTRNTQISLTPTFNVDPSLVPFWRSRGNNIVVSAWSQDIAPNFQLQLGFGQNHVHLQLNAQNQLTSIGWVQMDNLLPNYTNYYAPLSFSWAISPDGGTTWITPGIAHTSSNEAFITLANPVASGPIVAGVGVLGGIGQVQKPAIAHTVFYATIWGSISPANFFAGQPQYLVASDETELVTNVFASFRALDITRADGTPMTYYGSWNNRNYTTASLIRDHDGMCTAWARFFIDVLRAEGGNFSSAGAQSNLMEILPAWEPRTTLILVKNWTIPAQRNIMANLPNARAIRLGYTNYNNGNLNAQRVNGVWQYVWQDGVNANVQHDQNGIGGQNNGNPLSTFSDHFVVQIGNALYDPSYGVTYALGPANNPLVNFATAAVAGYASPWRFENQNQDYVVFQGPGDPADTSTRLVMRQQS